MLLLVNSFEDKQTHGLEGDNGQWLLPSSLTAGPYTGPAFSCPSSPYVTSLLLKKNSFSSVTQSCLTLCNPRNCSTPGLPVHHKLPEFTQTHVHDGDAIQPSHPLSSPSPPALNLSQQQVFKRGSSSHQVAKVFAFQLQQQSFE